MTRVLTVALCALALLAAPLVAEPQPVGTVARIGFLTLLSASLVPPAPLFAEPATTLSFREGLRRLGYLEGQNLVVERRYADGNADRLPGLAAELVELRVQLIVTETTAATRAAKEVTTKIPIVFTLGGDPVQRGLIASFARPGGNLTGFVWGIYDHKKLEILKEAVPGLSQVACLFPGERAASVCRSPAIVNVARRLGMEIRGYDVQNPEDMDRVFTGARRDGAGAVLVPDVGWLSGHSKRLADAAAKSRLPAVGTTTEFVQLGGLLYYGPKVGQDGARLAAYVDRILKGAQPSDLPAEQPTRFELVINLKTAKALGLTIPPAVLARADEVIQ
jgi:putative tryptophan/tyrosine transport system substrate-binding protein